MTDHPPAAPPPVTSWSIWSPGDRSVRAALRPGGHLVFETRRPEYRAWEEWAADVEPVTVDVPGSGQVQRRRAVTGVNLPSGRRR